MLDLALFMEGNQVRHSFYAKPMSSPFQVMYNSALSPKTKRSSLLQEGLRRFRNMGIGISQDEKNDVISKFMCSLKWSGYDHKFRYTLLRGILQQVANQESEIDAGTRQRFRNSDQILELKSKKLGKFPNTWFLRGTVQNTLKVQCTPSSSLVNALKKTLGEEIRAEGGTTKIVEMGGDLITSGLSGTVMPTGQQRCFFREKCITDPESDCMTSRTVYTVDCQNCRDDPTRKSHQYFGTSGHSMHKRQSEHAKAIIGGLNLML